VIGIGHPHRGDDAAGVLAARALKRQAPPGISIRESTGEALSLIERWQETDRVFLVDAVQSGAAAGTLHRFELDQGPAPFECFHATTHGFGVAGAIELARTLNRLPRCLIVYGIEGAAFGVGDALSPAVEQAALEVVRRICEEL
jgi:hydrogenase maturation protease